MVNEKQFLDCLDPKFKPYRVGKWYGLYMCKRCGNTHVSLTDNVDSMKTRSCGCYKNQRTSDTNSTHKQSTESIYKIWVGLKVRCYNKNCAAYKDYGGRGILMSDDWMRFENFVRDMGPRPNTSASIDRIDNNKGYSKDNCRWATSEEQGQNKRNRITIMLNNETMSLKRACRVSGLKYLHVYGKVKQALDKPPQEVFDLILRNKNEK